MRTLTRRLWVDRKEAIVGVLMVQEPVDTLRTDFQNAVMQAIIDSLAPRI